VFSSAFSLYSVQNLPSGAATDDNDDDAVQISIDESMFFTELTR